MFIFKKFLRTSINTVLIITIISTIINTIKQFITLKEARNKNIYLSEELINLEKDNKNLLRKIEYATSSAFLEQQSRIILGLGTNDDYWIEDKVQAEVSLYPEIKKQEKEANILKWIKLFTN